MGWSVEKTCFNKIRFCYSQKNLKFFKCTLKPKTVEVGERFNMKIMFQFSCIRSINLSDYNFAFIWSQLFFWGLSVSMTIYMIRFVYLTSWNFSAENTVLLNNCKVAKNFNCFYCSTNKCRSKCFSEIIFKRIISAFLYRVRLNCPR